MELYLSSNFVPNPEKLISLLPVPPEQARVAVLVSEADRQPGSEGRLKSDKLGADLTALGLLPRFIHLNWYGNAKMMQDHLSAQHLIYVGGENEEELSDEMHTTKFHTVVRNILQQGVVYAGQGAGASIVGESVFGHRGRVKGEDHRHVYPGLGLVDAIVAPHAYSRAYRGRAQRLRRLHTPLPIIAINDKNQDIVLTP